MKKSMAAALILVLAGCAEMQPHHWEAISNALQEGEKNRPKTTICNSFPSGVYCTTK